MAEDRTTAIGLLNYGRSFLAAARALQSTQQAKTYRPTHPHAPIGFLLGHAFELILKAHFRARGESLDQLKERSHDISKLLTDALLADLGVHVDENELGHLSLLNEQFGRPPYMIRYIVTGFARFPDYACLTDLAERISAQLYEVCMDAYRQDNERSESQH